MKSYSPEVETDIDVEELIKKAIKKDHGHTLIVWNDDVNTFDNVIFTLMEVCGHTHEQAEQCSMIIHFKGKCSVKNGEFEELDLMKDKIISRKIQATVEEL